MARTDPVTGEKRAIRKTYKGKIKSFNISGREKEVVHPPDQPGSLIETASWPAEEWYAQKVAGKPAQTGLSESILAKLEQALTMETGPVPNFDSNILGYEALPTADGKPPIPQGNVKAGSFSAPQPPNGTTPRITATAAAVPTAPAEPPRPKRTGKKRHYDERSFEGYGEGFVDDDADGAGAGGYSTSDGERRSRKKKRKKVTASCWCIPHSQPLSLTTTTDVRVLRQLRHIPWRPGARWQLRRGHGQRGKWLRGAVTRGCQRRCFSCSRASNSFVPYPYSASHR